MTAILYLNGNIYTMDAIQPRAQAMAIDSATGRILSLGTNDEVRRTAGQHSELFDLRGKTVLPGFIDAHMHLLSTAYRSHYIDAITCTSEDEVATLVRERASQTPPGRWIQGGQWDKNLWPGQHFPGKASLDAAAPNHPVVLWSKDGHLLWVNSLALQRANITATTPDPANGVILRDGSGEPTGILEEHEATNLVYNVIDPPDPAMTRVLVQRLLPRLQQSGITTIADIEDLDALQLFQQLHDEGQLGIRVHMILPRHRLPQLRETSQNVVAPLVGARGWVREEGDMIRIGGIKIFADGTLGSQTAAMLEGFEGNPHNLGILAISEQEMNETVSQAADLGLSIAIHAIGDRAAHVALNSIEKAQQHLANTGGTARGLSHLRYRLEHVQLITPVDLMALGSDAPVETFDPLRILHAATTRRDDTTQRPPWLPDQALPLPEALWGYTMGAAHAASEEHLKGSLSVGKLGDAIVLRENIFDVPQERMTENGVQATILGGKVVYGEV